MRTIQEKYNAILEGNFSKTQFLRDAKRELSQFLSPYNGYEDTVAILKNKGVLTEAKKEKATNYEPTPAGLPAEAVSRGIDYELEAIGVNTGVEMPTEEQLAKVTTKVNKNLAKNMNYYLDLIAGESKKVDKHDKLVATTKKNTVDTFNGMKKVSLKESVLEKAMSKGYTKEQVEAAIKNLKEKKGKDHDGDGDIDGDDYMAAKDKAIKGAKMDEVELANTTLTKANQAIKSPATLAQTFLSLYKQIQDKEQSDFSRHPKFGKVLGILQSMTKDQEEGNEEPAHEGIHDRNILSRPISNPAVGDYSMPPEMAKDHNDDRSYSQITSKYRKQINNPSISDEELEHILGGSGNPRMGGTPDAIKRVIQDRNKKSISEVEASIDPQKLEDMGYNAGEKALMDLDPEIFNQPNFNSYASGFIKGFQDNIEASQDYAAHYVNEGRRKKSKGGKIVTENDYETGGYIESMGPLFDRACDMLAKAFGEWVNGPMTEPGMIAPAKKDVINYLDQKLTSQFLEESNSVEESIDREFHSTSDTSGHPNPSKMSVPEIEAYIKDNPTTLWGRSLSIWKMVLNKKKGADTVRDEQLKEAFKAIISKVLTEEVITEAATGNLSKIADTYNDYEGMQTAVNALENIVTDVESYNSKTRDKIQKIYDSLKDIKNVDGLVVGSFLAPAIEAAFRKDLSPVSQKGFTTNLALPKTNVIKSGEVQEEELDEKETVFTPMSEITAAQQKYVDKVASKPSKPVKTQLRKDTQAAKRAIDSGKLTDQQIIKKYGQEAFNAVNAENEYNEGVNESRKTKYTKR
tara:strand:+ start:563 stop:2965 length:2403 start_codon:yes stop_codon:yes gene_type:complete